MDELTIEWRPAPDELGDAYQAVVRVNGDPGCWPLVARLQVREDEVTWSDFAQPHRPTWDLTGLGPFVFERAQYEAALGSSPPPAGQ